MHESTAQPDPAAAPSATHLVLIPSYDSGALVVDTVRAARCAWNPVWVVFDGSRDGSDAALTAAFGADPGVRIFRLPSNQGKGAAVLHGLRAAQAAGFTHALTMDADGQHPADHIARFMALSMNDPGAMILGRPIFAADAPALRVQGRKVSNFWARLETLWAGVDDSLFGFRVYPIAPLVAVMHAQSWMRRFDFDVEAVVRLCWRGVRPLSTGTPVRYLSTEEGGVSHFNYLRDNALLSWMHARLFLGFLLRLPQLLWRRIRTRRAESRRAP
ncbi:MAG: glycosyltransferase family 2 protein [Burkholderiaceae bacterium]|nr:glycosyltransferase family 2 protein [Burkholderiaceae bacterium]